MHSPLTGDHTNTILNSASSISSSSTDSSSHYMCAGVKPGGQQAVSHGSSSGYSSIQPVRQLPPSGTYTSHDTSVGYTPFQPLLPQTPSMPPEHIIPDYETIQAISRASQKTSHLQDDQHRCTNYENISKTMSCPKISTDQFDKQINLVSEKNLPLIDSSPEKNYECLSVQEGYRKHKVVDGHYSTNISQGCDNDVVTEQTYAIPMKPDHKIPKQKESVVRGGSIRRGNPPPIPPKPSSGFSHYMTSGNATSNRIQHDHSVKHSTNQDQSVKHSTNQSKINEINAGIHDKLQKPSIVRSNSNSNCQEASTCLLEKSNFKSPLNEATTKCSPNMTDVLDGRKNIFVDPDDVAKDNTHMNNMSPNLHNENMQNTDSRLSDAPELPLSPPPKTPSKIYESVEMKIYSKPLVLPKPSFRNQLLSFKKMEDRYNDKIENSIKRTGSTSKQQRNPPPKPPRQESLHSKPPLESPKDSFSPQNVTRSVIHSEILEMEPYLACSSLNGWDNSIEMGENQNQVKDQLIHSSSNDALKTTLASKDTVFDELYNISFHSEHNHTSFIKEETTDPSHTEITSTGSVAIGTSEFEHQRHVLSPVCGKTGTQELSDQINSVVTTNKNVSKDIPKEDHTCAIPSSCNKGDMSKISGDAVAPSNTIYDSSKIHSDVMTSSDTKQEPSQISSLAVTSSDTKQEPSQILNHRNITRRRSKSNSSPNKSPLKLHCPNKGSSSSKTPTKSVNDPTDNLRKNVLQRNTSMCSALNTSLQSVSELMDDMINQTETASDSVMSDPEPGRIPLSREHAPTTSENHHTITNCSTYGHTIENQMGALCFNNIAETNHSTPVSKNAIWNSSEKFEKQNIKQGASSSEKNIPKASKQAGTVKSLYIKENSPLTIAKHTESTRRENINNTSNSRTRNTHQKNNTLSKTKKSPFNTNTRDQLTPRTLTSDKSRLFQETRKATLLRDLDNFKATDFITTTKSSFEIKNHAPIATESSTMLPNTDKYAVNRSRGSSRKSINDSFEYSKQLKQSSFNVFQKYQQNRSKFYTQINERHDHRRSKDDMSDVVSFSVSQAKSEGTLAKYLETDIDSITRPMCHLGVSSFKVANKPRTNLNRRRSKSLETIIW